MPSSCTDCPASKGLLLLVAGPPYCHRLAVSSRAKTAMRRPLEGEAAAWVISLGDTRQKKHEQCGSAA